MSWFRKKKDKDSISDTKERQIEDILLSFALEAYQGRNFSTSFKFDNDREDMEFTPNLEDVADNDNYEKVVIKYLEKKIPFVVINKNQSSSWYYGTGAYKTGGINFNIYVRNEEGHILVYGYDNFHYKYRKPFIYNYFIMYNTIYDGSYYNHQKTEVDYAFDKRLSDKTIRVKIHRMKKLEKLVSLMLDEQTIDQHDRNIDKMNRILGYIPRKNKRDIILKELLNE